MTMRNNRLPKRILEGLKHIYLPRLRITSLSMKNNRVRGSARPTQLRSNWNVPGQNAHAPCDRNRRCRFSPLNAHPFKPLDINGLGVAAVIGTIVAIDRSRHMQETTGQIMENDSVRRDPEPDGVTRRRFLKWTTAMSALVTGAVATIPPLRAFLSPATQGPEPKRWIKLGRTSLFQNNVPKRIDFSETVSDAWVETMVQRGVWVYTEDGEDFTVYNGRCTHLGCAYGWDIEPDPRFHPESDVFHCPCHHAIFKLTGDMIRGPAPRPLDTLDTKIEDGVLYTAYQDFRVGIPDKIPV